MALHPAHPPQVTRASISRRPRAARMHSPAGRAPSEHDQQRGPGDPRRGGAPHPRLHPARADRTPQLRGASTPSWASGCSGVAVPTVGDSSPFSRIVSAGARSGVRQSPAPRAEEDRGRHDRLLRLAHAQQVLLRGHPDGRLSTSVPLAHPGHAVGPHPRVPPPRAHGAREHRDILDKYALRRTRTPARGHKEPEDI